MRMKQYTKLNRMIVSLVSLVMLVCILTGCGQKDGPAETIAETTIPQETQAEMSISDLLKATLTLKDDLETALDCIKEDDLDAAREKVASVTEKTATIRKSLNATMANIGGSMPSMQKELQNMQGLLDLVDMSASKLLEPAMAYMAAHPLEEMRSGDGIRTDLICDYLDFAEGLMPEVTALVAHAGTVDLALVDSDGEIAAYLAAASELLDMYGNDSTVFAQLKNMLGANGDRLYVVAAQNSAEIRASGGFPGAVGTIRIQDGILTIEDFKRVNTILLPNALPEANVTSHENYLFPGGMAYPRDADFCPDFERVGYIWAKGYERLNKEEVAGVISLTPAVVQKLLNILDEEIKLFDGSVLDGESAMRVLQRDLYYKYFGSTYVVGGNSTADQLFADAAKKTSQLLMENMSAGNLLDYVSLAGDCFEARELMLWMQDEGEQELLRKFRWNAGLPADPSYPQTGLYFSLTVACKLGWYYTRDVEIGQRVKNDDGSYTYPVTVTMSNTLTNDELQEASYYIKGTNNGSIVGNAYFFAPAGGSVSNFHVSTGLRVSSEVYNGLQLGYLRKFSLKPGASITVTYDVTTAPGAEMPLMLSMTPTLQEYH